MNVLESLSATHDLLRNYLIQESYSHGCNCRNCDALTKVHEAQEQIKTLITHLVSCENPSSESKAQERSKAVADRESPLAVAQRTMTNSARYNLFVDGKLVRTDWADSMLDFVAEKGYNLSIIPR